MTRKYVAAYILRGMRVQNPEMFENLNLPLSCQVLVSEEDNTAFVDKCSKLIQLFCVKLT
jgi:hypothetical protein